MRARNGEYVTHFAIELHTLFTIGVLAFFLLPDSPRRNTSSASIRWNSYQIVTTSVTIYHQQQRGCARTGLSIKSYLLLALPLYGPRFHRS